MHTSIGGEFLGFDRKKEKTRARKRKNEKKKKHRNTIYSHPKGGCKFEYCYYRTAEKVTFLTKNCPPIEVCAIIYIYIYDFQNI